MHLPDNTLLQGGKYKIVRFIASGGFGCTYEATHTNIPGSRIVIKELFIDDFCVREHYTRVTVTSQTKMQIFGSLKKKFFEEGVALFNMHHPSIVGVTDVFEENGTAYYAMDFIDGQSLQEIVAVRGHVPERLALEYMKQILDAVEYVHSLNRLHLDIKPSNIMISSTGRAILIDFGASKQYDDKSKEQLSTLLGINTLGYAPVEQINRTFRHFSAATDIYAIGATLYKILTGTTPPNAVSLLSQEESLVPLPPYFSAGTRNAVEQALKLLRGDRPQSIAQFRNLLFGQTGATQVAQTRAGNYSGTPANDESTKCDYQVQEAQTRRAPVPPPPVPPVPPPVPPIPHNPIYQNQPQPVKPQGKGFAKVMWFVFYYIFLPWLSVGVGGSVGDYIAHTFDGYNKWGRHIYVGETYVLVFSIAFIVLTFFVVRLLFYRLSKKMRMSLYGKETSSGWLVFYIVMVLAAIITLIFMCIKQAEAYWRPY